MQCFVIVACVLQINCIYQSVMRRLLYVANWKNATTAFKKHEDSDCHKQAIGLSILPQQCGDIGKLMHQHLKEEKNLNRDMLLVILRAIRYLSHQGLLLRGHESIEGNLSSY